MVDVDTSRNDGSNQGNLYGRKPAAFDPELIEVGAGTSFGELLRRFWQPFALSTEITTDLPVPIRILGESLVAFRDADGKVGLVYPRCMHRGADLLYGKIEPQGIRCPYHGWLFDTTGHLLDTPCELDPSNKALHNIIRQPWYPVMEKFGLVFAYMGPPEKRPQFPRFPEILEDLEEDEEVVASGSSQPYKGWPAALNAGDMDYNWLQYFENFMDPLHLGALHGFINGNQFTEDLQGNPNPCKFRTMPDGAGATWIGIWESPRNEALVTQSIFQCVLPNILISGPTFGLAVRGLAGVSWIVPADDTNFRQFFLHVAKKGSNTPRPVMTLNLFKPDWGPGREKEPYVGWTLEDKQRWQTDYLIQKSLGERNLHSDEHLTRSDAGVVAIRRILKRQAKIVQDGGDPIGANIDEPFVVNVIGGTALLDVDSGEVREGFAKWTLKDYA
jgi:nitrite reductase/ring-hydroxylating ferredoxin subunit